ncbi:MAG TPA: response regulator transcription factor [Jatrophihabitantaceae bacterium]|jgi:DNA-binding NarL/FixJ family response regulator
MTRAFPATPLTVEDGRPPIRLLIVDGHPVTRSGVARVADEQDDVQIVAETGSVAEAMRLADTLHPHVVTIGTSLLDGDGLSLARDLRDGYATMGIVVLTSRGEDDVLFRALETGASAFVSKAATMPEIIAAIRHAAAAATSFTAAGLAQALRRRQAAPDRLRLSPREREVLTLLQEGRSVPAIAARLCISLSTAKTYVARLYDKLGATNRATALMAAVRIGLIVQPPVAVG